MIEYKASDLVTAAMKLADLENSSFISASENRMYINNAWAEIYQQAIDNGEQYWLKEADVENGENDLPEDFYQLYLIKDHTDFPVKRFSKNDDKTTRWYRIKNDKIVLNKVHGGAHIEYFPVPDTLDISGEGDVVLAFPNNIYKQLLVYTLAEYYKIRQNQDPSTLELLIDKCWDQFYDMIGRDDNDYEVIMDVRHNRWIY